MSKRSRLTFLGPGEQVHAKLVADHVWAGRVFEGTLVVTSKRLVFVPWLASVALGEAPFDIRLADVSMADVAPRAADHRAGGRRQRLRITLNSGNTELFVVRRPRKAAGLVDKARRDGTRTP